MHQRQQWERLLALAAAVRWNAHFFMATGPMRAKKFQLPDFENCSVALFASLVFMGPLAARAQQPPPARPAITAPGAVPLPRLLPYHRPVATRPEPDWRSSGGEPDGSISSPGFDEALK